MSIGSWGNIVFKVSSSTVRTFDGLTHTATSRWALHDVMNGKPRAQFGGPGQHEISFTIRLSSSLGVDPRREMEKVVKAVDDGLRAPFILSGKPIGKCDWYIESCETTFVSVGKGGQVDFADMSLTMKEYF